MAPRKKSKKAAPKKKSTVVSHHCDVCHLDGSPDHNQLLTCNKCKVMIHQQCCGSAKRPGKYICGGCKGVKGKAKERECCVCRKTGGAMAITNDKKLFVHISCAIWAPENVVKTPQIATLRDELPPIQINKTELKKISPAVNAKNAKTRGKGKTIQLCQICDKNCGVIRCSHDNCKNYFHPRCVYEKYGDERIIYEEDEIDPVKLVSPWTALFCDSHAREKVLRLEEHSHRNGTVNVTPSPVPPASKKRQKPDDSNIVQPPVKMAKIKKSKPMSQQSLSDEESSDFSSQPSSDEDEDNSVPFSQQLTQAPDSHISSESSSDEEAHLDAISEEKIGKSEKKQQEPIMTEAQQEDIDTVGGSSSSEYDSEYDDGEYDSEEESSSSDDNANNDNTPAPAKMTKKASDNKEPLKKKGRLTLSLKTKPTPESSAAMNPSKPAFGFVSPKKSVTINSNGQEQEDSTDYGDSSSSSSSSSSSPDLNMNTKKIPESNIDDEESSSSSDNEEQEKEQPQKQEKEKVTTPTKKTGYTPDEDSTDYGDSSDSSSSSSDEGLRKPLKSMLKASMLRKKGGSFVDEDSSSSDEEEIRAKITTKQVKPIPFASKLTPAKVMKPAAAVVSKTTPIITKASTSKLSALTALSTMGDIKEAKSKENSQTISGEESSDGYETADEESEYDSSSSSSSSTSSEEEEKTSKEQQQKEESKSSPEAEETSNSKKAMESQQSLSDEESSDSNSENESIVLPTLKRQINKSSSSNKRRSPTPEKSSVEPVSKVSRVEENENLSSQQRFSQQSTLPMELPPVQNETEMPTHVTTTIHGTSQVSNNSDGVMEIVNRAAGHIREIQANHDELFTFWGMDVDTNAAAPSAKLHFVSKEFLKYKSQK